MLAKDKVMKCFLKTENNKVDVCKVTQVKGSKMITEAKSRKG